MATAENRKYRVAEHLSIKYTRGAPQPALNINLAAQIYCIIPIMCSAAKTNMAVLLGDMP